MLKKESMPRIIDNSGAKLAKCIHIYGGFKKQIAKIAETILVSIKQLRNKKKARSKVQVKQLHFSLILLTKMILKEFSNISYTFFDNLTILLTKQSKPIGSRFYVKIPQKIRFTTHWKLVSLANGVII